MRWTEKTNEADAKIRFKVDTGLLPPSLAAGIAWYHAESQQWGDRNANYATRCDILINHTNVQWKDNAVRAIAWAHEIGHLTGLHERINQSDISIMDQMVADDSTSPPTIIRHVDNITGPTSTDITRVQSYWRYGTTNNLTQSRNGTTITVKWKDYAWAESFHNVNFYYQNGSTWVQYHQALVTNNIGIHENHSDPTRDIQYSCNYASYGAPGNRYHKVVITPAMSGWQVAGQGTWGQAKELMFWVP